MEILIVVVLVALAVAAAWFSHHQKVKRRTELNHLALANDLSFSMRDVLGLEQMPFAFLRRGDDRGVENVLHGDLGGERVRVFDFWVMHESTDSKGNRSRRYERYTCAALQVSDAWWPALTIKPESVMTRIGDVVGLRDLEFESDEFNRAWDVTCPDRRFAYAFIDARMMRWLQMAGRDYRFEVSGPYLMVVCDRLAPSSWMTLHRVVSQLSDRVPAVARELYPAAD